MFFRAEKYVSALARCMAIAGGAALIAMALLTCVSIVGRMFLWAGLQPVKGDFELVAAGTGFAVCAFLPWCQLNGGHAATGLLIDRFGQGVGAFFDFLTDLGLLAAALFFTWRHGAGLMDKLSYPETSFILNFPIWWVYAGMLAGLCAWVPVAAWCTLASLWAVKNGTRRVIDAGAAR